MRFENQNFSNQDVLLDGNEFIGCTFAGCRIQTAGILGAVLNACVFNTCSWGFIGPAANAITLLVVLYAQGGDARGVVEQTISNIRNGERPQILNS